MKNNVDDLKERVKELIEQMPDISEITICPSLFSNDYEKHDCNICECSLDELGDVFDADVCIDCWKRAIDSY